VVCNFALCSGIYISHVRHDISAARRALVLRPPALASSCAASSLLPPIGTLQDSRPLKKQYLGDIYLTSTPSTSAQVHTPSRVQFWFGIPAKCHATNPRGQNAAGIQGGVWRPEGLHQLRRDADPPVARGAARYAHCPPPPHNHCSSCAVFCGASRSRVPHGRHPHLQLERVANATNAARCQRPNAAFRRWRQLLSSRHSPALHHEWYCKPYCKPPCSALQASRHCTASRSPIRSSLPARGDMLRHRGVHTRAAVNSWGCCAAHPHKLICDCKHT
jgi:hypothetical protein